MKLLVALRRFALTLIALPALTGCTYLANRGKDLSDIIFIGASAGGGMQLRARATPLLTAEIGAQKDERFYGWRRRNSEWEESSYGLFFANFWSPRLGNEPFAPWSGWNLLKTSHTKAKFLSVPSEGEWKYHLFLLTPVDNVYWLDAFDVEATVGLFFIGFQVGVRPGELLDLLAGIFALDPAADDGVPDATSAEAYSASAVPVK